MSRHSLQSKHQDTDQSTVPGDNSRMTFIKEPAMKMHKDKDEVLSSLPSEKTFPHAVP